MMFTEDNYSRTGKHHANKAARETTLMNDLRENTLIQNGLGKNPRNMDGLGGTTLPSMVLEVRTLLHGFVLRWKTLHRHDPR